MYDEYNGYYKRPDTHFELFGLNHSTLLSSKYIFKSLKEEKDDLECENKEFLMEDESLQKDLLSKVDQVTGENKQISDVNKKITLINNK